MDWKKALLKVVNLSGLKSLILEDLFDQVIDKKLQEIVDDTSNPFDNALKSMILPELRKAADKYLEEQIASVQASLSQP